MNYCVVLLLGTDVDALLLVGHAPTVIWQLTEVIEMAEESVLFDCFAHFPTLLEHENLSLSKENPMLFI